MNCWRDPLPPNDPQEEAMHFIIDCRDGEQGRQLRSHIRDQHLAHLNTRRASILTAGSSAQ